jgi:hypothetical protein
MTIIMLGGSYGTKIYEEQERNISRYCHKPIVHRWTTPNSYGVDVEDVGEGGDPSSGGFGGVFPSNVPCWSLCFHVSVLPRSP